MGKLNFALHFQSTGYIEFLSHSHFSILSRRRLTMPVSNWSTPVTRPFSCRSSLCNGPIWSFARPDAIRSSTRVSTLFSFLNSPIE
jgi:hypothetical protein